VDAAHPAGMLVADTVRSGAKAELEGSIGGQRGRVIDKSFFFHGRRFECEKCSKRRDGMLGNNLSYPPGLVLSSAY